MIAQLKKTGQRGTVVIEKICSKEFLFCLLIKDEIFDDRGEDFVLRTLVPEKFPDFVIAQVILQTSAGWLPQFNRAQCRAEALLPADYQQIMLAAPFLTGSLRKLDSGVGYGRVLLVGLGARSIASYIQYHLFRMEIDELIIIEKDQYLNKIWLNNPTWGHVTVSDIR
uniref:XdhC_C domain-containing protein n=1 Tax=Elaeophora elaphi TaxID=1147741 RepID=A0A0R3RNK6_9BILA